MNPILSRVDRSKELGFYVAEFTLAILREFDPLKMQTRVNFDFDMEPTKRIAIIHLSVEVSYAEEFVLLDHNCVFEFLISDITQALHADGLLLAEVVFELVKESYALARGMIAVRTQGFGVQDFPLPFLDQRRVMDHIAELLASRRAAVDV